MTLKELALQYGAFSKGTTSKASAVVIHLGFTKGLGRGFLTAIEFPMGKMGGPAWVLSGDDKGRTVGALVGR
ncbi:hypothetical protein TIFTF001_014984 [Ficus carica]|uniref:Uncharacterized protein n=1 Tax=Ficus carica TaxID=3494 RepID=A0AA88A711_FICCA|nr:hypothetical protein TIFTF001_014984 [Ficus carica]